MLAAKEAREEARLTRLISPGHVPPPTPWQPKGYKGGKGGKGKGKEPGDGMGEGKGEGDRDEEESEFKDYDAQVRDEMRKGETVNGGKTGGKNRKGATREEARQAVLSAQPDEPDAIENIQLPKAQRDQLKEYFNSLRGEKKD